MDDLREGLLFCASALFCVEYWSNGIVEEWMNETWNGQDGL